MSGPVSAVLRANLARIRTERNLTYVALSRRMDEEGQPIPVLGLRRMERGERRVDVDELAAFAKVLGTTTDALLQPPSECGTCYGLPMSGFTCNECGTRHERPQSSDQRRNDNAQPADRSINDRMRDGV